MSEVKKHLKACGVVVEYNPFHNGHAYQLREARRLSKADVMICVMSGNFTQRGELAVVDKWKRAQVAIENGADLVVELPVRFSVQPADLFAQGAIQMLHGLGCDSLSFGVEEDRIDELEDLVQVLLSKKEQFEQIYQDSYQAGRSYAENMNQSLAIFYSKERGQALELNFKSQPNLMLAFRYLYANQFLNDGKNRMQIFPVIRTSSHHSKEYSGAVASGTAIRHLLTQDNKTDIYKLVPKSMADALLARVALDWTTIWPYLRYQLTVQETGALKEIYMVEEGIEGRLKKQLKNAESFEDFIQKVKTRRWSHPSLQRMLMMVALQISKKEMLELLTSTDVPAHILAFNSQGQKYLTQVRKETPLRLISRVNQITKGSIHDILQADQFYQLLDSKIEEQNYSKQPIRY